VIRRTILTRVAWCIPTLIAVSFLVFLLLAIAPGDPAREIAGPEASQEAVAQIRENLGLDRPLLVRYGEWLGDAVRGDLGNSIISDRPVTDSVFKVLGISASLIVVGVTFAIVGSLVLALTPVLTKSRVAERICSLLSAAAIATPSFWLALVLVQALAVERRWLPAVGYVGLADDPVEWFRHLVIPGIAIGASVAGHLARQMRSSVAEVMATDYVMAARAKGVGHRRLVLKHVLKNAAIPVVTVLGIRVGQLFGATVLVEQIFLINGLGDLTLRAVLSRDVPVVLGILVVVAALIALINLIVDASYLYFNPKVRSA
jgi:peptide/nickel transport system permease protein